MHRERGEKEADSITIWQDLQKPELQKV